uniref:Uncharacterized protein n=1 Tax=Pristionchus pacificus TaxID=54126 RepID=A0A454XTE9_PRIPA|eukprot:PDM73237.1 hypothetical protein PRIPAC_40593 [Pristionchus pacificus]
MGRVKKSAPWAPGRGRNVNRPINAEAASSDDHLFAPADECDIVYGAGRNNDDVDIDDDVDIEDNLSGKFIVEQKPEGAATTAPASASDADSSCSDADPSASTADPSASDADAPPASPPSSIASRVKARHAAKREEK